MSFTDQKRFVATAGQCKLNWSGGKNGKYFRCGLCDHKFKADDGVRFVFTNNIPDAPAGNFFVCDGCDGAEVLDRWKAMGRRFKEIKQEFWSFLRGYAAEVEQEYENDRCRSERR